MLVKPDAGEEEFSAAVTVTRAEKLLAWARKRGEEAKKSLALPQSPGAEPQQVIEKESVHLPVWPNAVRGVPNPVLRSALFGAIKRDKRVFQQRVKKASFEGVTLIHTGPQLDQADLDVWAQCLHLARTGGLGTRIEFTASGFLKDIARSAGKSQYVWLKDAFARLSSSTLELADGQRAYSGPLLIGASRDDESGHYVIEMNPKIVSLFGIDGWSSIEFEARAALKKQPLAQWLHGFYLSHATPFELKVETLHRLCGSQAKKMFSFRQELRKSLDKLAEVTGWTWEIDDSDLVHVAKTCTGSQRRYIMKRLKPLSKRTA